MMNIVVPLAGRARSFMSSKFKYPRWGVEINGINILERSLRGLGDAHYFFICLKSHYEKYDMGKMIHSIVNDAIVLLVDTTSEGQACSVLWSKKHISNDDPLLIVSPEQIINWDPKNFYEFIDETNCDVANVICDSLITGSNPMYAKVNFETGCIAAISANYQQGWYPSCGVFYFKYGWYFDRFAKQMISREDRVDDEFWIAPCLNDAIIDGKVVKPYLASEVAILDKPVDVREFANDFPNWAHP